MTARFGSVAASVFLVVSMAPARAGCNPGLTERYTGTQKIIDSLRPDKPGQMRVIASDGSAYTAAETRWMKSQLRSVQQACAQGDEAAAVSALQGVLELLRSHRRAP